MPLKVMLDGLERKRDIYDKRPEDHPNYPEEWKLFWERRYKELQSQGQDPDHYNYKADWIPFWGKRANEIYEDELKSKTQELLMTFALLTRDEPKRSDFASSYHKPSPVKDNDLMIVEERPRRRSRSRSRSRSHRYRGRRSRSPPTRSRSPGRFRSSYSPGYDRYNERERSSTALSPSFSNEPPQLMTALRVVTALEDLLGSLAPQIDVVMTRAIALENKQDGTSNLLLEDPDIAAVLQMTKEKLSGQILAGLLDHQKELAVRSCVDKLNILLQCATKKRPSHPPDLLAVDPKADDKSKFKAMFAEQLAKVLIQKDMEKISEYALHCLVYEIAKTTELDDGTLCPPPDEPPKEPTPEPTPPPSNYQSYQPQSGSG